jgi:hypothetical protein
MLQLASVPKFGGSGGGSGSAYQCIVSIEVLRNLFQRRVPRFDVVSPDDGQLDCEPNALFQVSLWPR